MSYEDILSRCPEVTWTPMSSPSPHDLSRRDEMLDQKLRTAARWMWSFTIDFANADEALQPSEEWTASEADSLRALLVTIGSGEPVPVGRWWEQRVYVLRNLGISQAYASSSRRAEQAAESEPMQEMQRLESESEPEPAHHETNAIRDWVLGSVGQG